MSNVIIVSNRLPMSVKKVDGKLEYSASIGGLATGLSSYATRRQSMWIGWPGIVSEELTETDKQLIARRLKRDHCYPVFLTQSQVDHYYTNYSNSVLWPFLHNLSTNPSKYERDWATYRKVNQLFADAIIALSLPKSTIWVHDYLLMLVPEMIRAERPYDSIGFFLHTPFPDADHYQQLPHGRGLLKGLLGADLVGFHTPAYVDNFLDACQELSVGLVSPGRVVLPDRTVRVTDFPISIDYTKYAQATRLPAVRAEVRRLKKKYDKYKIILAFDRLDLTKGFLVRLKAYRQFLQENPAQRNKVQMIMIAAPSRTELPAYRKLRQQVESLVKDINEEFGTTRWKPIEYMFKSLPFEQVTAFYEIADVAFITPLKDGMNLMAKEYIATKRNKKGVLILSETAGAAQELTDAILVNPAKPRTLVNALSEALTMRPRELKGRLASMQDHLSSHTIHHWTRSFMSSLQTSSGVPLRTRHFTRQTENQLFEDFHAAQRRLILLDYDGVLIELAEKYYQAKPPRAVVQLLRRLAEDPANHIVVISGRSKDDLENWLGELPVTLAAEHGTLVKQGKDWRRLVESPRSWKKLLKPVLEKHTAATPGALLEEKDNSLVWHYRKASPYYAQKNLVILRQALKPVLRAHGLKAYNGSKILEIKSASINKGIAVAGWLKKSTDFILAMGDDYTDEDMFRALPPEAYTVKVGPGRTAARFRVDTVTDADRLLRKLAK